MSVAVEENPNFRSTGEFLSIGLDLGQTLFHHVHFDASFEHLQKSRESQQNIEKGNQGSRMMIPNKWCGIKHRAIINQLEFVDLPKWANSAVRMGVWYTLKS